VPLVGGANNGTYANATLNNVSMRPPAFANMDATNVAPSVNRNGATLYTALSSIAGVGTGAYSIQAWFNSSAAFNSSLLSYVFARGVGRRSHRPPRRRGRVGLLHPDPSSAASPPKSPHRQALLLPGNNVSDSFIAYGSTILGPNTWYHTVLVRDADNIKVYLNGIKEIDATRAWQGGTGDRFTAGNRVDYPSVTLGMAGLYDEVAVWEPGAHGRRGAQPLHRRLLRPVHLRLPPGRPGQQPRGLLAPQRGRPHRLGH